MSLQEWFGLDDRVAVVTGGTGALGSAMAAGLAAAGARVAILSRHPDDAGDHLALAADVLRRDEVEAARDRVLAEWGRVDILVNAAGGNVPGATLDAGGSVFDLPEDAFRDVVDLNLVGTLLPTQVFGAAMDGEGAIVNVSSMASARAITRVIGYGAAKAAVENVTRWLAVELAPGIRVNAIAPGFFIGEQNRALLLEPDGTLTARGRAIIERTPAGRFGEADELVGTLVWLCSPAARFVTGTVVAVDGGFGAFSGV
ncbi:MAG TPA: SDR family oxidoreductase [Solirubrobacteraceae bacterium]|nr:SDR family oxidoreductase [Solirubrobacteraceae bacterium]